LSVGARCVFLSRCARPRGGDILPEPIHTVGLAMEGSRWLDEYRRIRRGLVHDKVVLGRGKVWPGTDLAPLEQRIARAVDGRKSLADLYKELRGSYFRFLE